MKEKQERKCSQCRQPGHTRRTCPAAGERASEISAEIPPVSTDVLDSEMEETEELQPRRILRKRPLVCETKDEGSEDETVDETGDMTDEDSSFIEDQDMDDFESDEDESSAHSGSTRKRRKKEE